MDNNKLVSVVIATYNGSKYIRESIEAVIGQTYKNLEIIIVDDGSTDNTYRLCIDYAEKDNRIKVIKTDNQGVSAARNVGINNSKGDYIVFVDDDDYPEARMIESFVEAFLKWNKKAVAFVLCGIILENDYDKKSNDRTILLESGRGYIEGENYLLSRNSVSTLAWLKLFNFVTNKCYKLGKIKECGIYFDTNVNVGEDLKFNLDYLEADEGNIGITNIPLYHYIKRKENGLSLKYHEGDIENTKDIYREFISWEKAQLGVNDDNIYVLESLYIYDWTNRLTSLYLEYKGKKDFCLIKKRINRELKSKEYMKMLKEVRKNRKISLIRYLCLRTGRYEVFYLARRIYMFSRGYR